MAHNYKVGDGVEVLSGPYKGQISTIMALSHSEIDGYMLNCSKLGCFFENELKIIKRNTNQPLFSLRQLQSDGR